MRRSIVPALALGAVLVAAGLTAVADSSQGPLTFRFAPPAGTAFRETSKVVFGVPLRQVRQRTLETEAVTRVRLDRQGDKPVLVTSLVSATNKLNDQPQDLPVNQVLPGVELTYALGADGRIVDLPGLDAVVAHLRQTLEPARYNQVWPQLDKEVLLARRQTLANPALPALAGKSLRIGETATSDGSITLPSAESFPVRVKATLKAAEPTPACPACVRVDFTAEPVPQSGKPAAVGATASGTALIDPATLVTWSLHHETSATVIEPGTPNNLIQEKLTVDTSLAPDSGAPVQAGSSR